MKNHPHDEFFKFLFSLTGVARAFMQAFLPPDIVSWLDLDTLAPDETDHITPELAAVYSDKVFTCRLKNTGSKRGKPLMAMIAILLEHKSFVPRFPHFQLNEYRQRIWTSKDWKKSKPPIVLPIILYHGQKDWKIKALADYFGKIPKVFKPYIGGFDYILVDLSEYPDEKLLQLKLGFLAYGMLTMKHAQDKKWLHDQFKIIFEKGEEFLKTEEGQNFVERLFVYYAQCSEISGQDLKKKVVQNLSQTMQTRTLSTYEQLILEGKIEGKTEQAYLIAKKLIVNFPQLTDEQIADLTDIKTAEVKKIRADLKKKKGEKTLKGSVKVGK